MTIKAEVKTMALKNLFDMVKADRYTADGREAIIKAQEEETEDKVYQIGEISQKTGLQKTANGWVKPKNGKKKNSEAEAGKTSRMDAWLNEDPSKMSDQELMRRNETLHSLGNSAKGDDFKKVMNAGIKIEEELTKRKLPTNPGGIGYEEEKKKAGSKPAAEKQKTEKGPAMPKPSVQEYMKAKQRVKAYEDQYKKDMDDYEYMERIKANGVDTSIFNPMYGGKPKPLEENKSYMEELNKIKAYEATDSAPRVLTGDTRIRVRKA